MSDVENLIAAASIVLHTAKEAGEKVWNDHQKAIKVASFALGVFASACFFSPFATFGISLVGGYFFSDSLTKETKWTVLAFKGMFFVPLESEGKEKLTILPVKRMFFDSSGAKYEIIDDNNEDEYVFLKEETPHSSYGLNFDKIKRDLPGLALRVGILGAVLIFKSSHVIGLASGICLSHLAKSLLSNSK